LFRGVDIVTGIMRENQHEVCAEAIGGREAKGNPEDAWFQTALDGYASRHAATQRGGVLVMALESRRPKSSSSA
jgi:hypothetical protein